MAKLEVFLRTWDQEYKTSLRVFASYPSNRLNYHPHEKSKTALELMWTIAHEEAEFIGGCLRGTSSSAPGNRPRPKQRGNPEIQG